MTGIKFMLIKLHSFGIVHSKKKYDSNKLDPAPYKKKQ